MDNDELLQAAKDAVTALFSDSSVSVSKAKENLQEIIDDCEVMIDSLPSES